MQNDNPMATFLDIMTQVAQNNQSPCLGIGKVISTEPLQIRYNGIILEQKELWINDYLWTNHERTAKGHIVSGTQSADCGCGNPHAHGIDNDYTDNIITTDTDLKPGYYVAIMPLLASEDGTKQQYVVLCHIMRLDGKYA